MKTIEQLANIDRAYRQQREKTEMLRLRRSELIAIAVSEGISQAEIARRLEVSPARVNQLGKESRD